mmetsp:Transcript_24185/g.35170  ORF Transcript_24185/g.35170 Transcript_24185/m.35170 type:complete len:108 (-) Transcript_24185:288-611(-)
MEGVLPLMEVDRILDGWKEVRDERTELNQIKALIEVDQEVDRARIAVDLLVDSLKHHTKKKDLDQIISNPMTYQFPPPPPQKHSLRDVQDLLKVDEFIDGKNTRRRL